MFLYCRAADRREATPIDAIVDRRSPLRRGLLTTMSLQQQCTLRIYGPTGRFRVALSVAPVDSTVADIVAAVAAHPSMRGVAFYLATEDGTRLEPGRPLHGDPVLRNGAIVRAILATVDIPKAAPSSSSIANTTAATATAAATTTTSAARLLTSTTGTNAAPVGRKPTSASSIAAAARASAEPRGLRASSPGAIGGGGGGKNDPVEREVIRAADPRRVEQLVDEESLLDFMAPPHRQHGTVRRHPQAGGVYCSGGACMSRFQPQQQQHRVRKRNCASTRVCVRALRCAFMRGIFD